MATAKRKSTGARAFLGALAGAGSSLSASFDQMAIDQRQRRTQDAITARQIGLDLQNREQQIQDQVAKGEISQQQGMAMLASLRSSGGRGMDLGAIAPDPTKRVAPVVAGIEKATDAPAVPDAGTVISQLRGLGLPVVPQHIGDGADPGLSPVADLALGVRRRKLDAFEDQRQSKITDAGATVEAQELARERAAAANAPGVLGREADKTRTLGAINQDLKVGEFQRLTPLEVDRSKQTELAVGPLRTKQSIAASTGAHRINNQTDVSMGLDPISVADNRKKNGSDLRPVLASSAQQIADITSGLKQLDALEAKIGKTGPLAGLAASLHPSLVPMGQRIGLDPIGAKSRDSVVKLSRQALGKTLEGGVLRKEDEAKYADILPTLSDDEEIVKNKLIGLRTKLMDERQIRLDALKDAGYNVDKLQQRANDPAGLR